jgi:DNA-binding MarR family transcriptional regulator
LTTQQLSPQVTSASRAFGRLVHAHSTVRAELETELAGTHEISVTEFSVLLSLSKEPDRQMRRVDIADAVNLSPSGITRLLDRLMAEGLVEKGDCGEDARVSYAKLTDKGFDRCVAAVPVYDAAVDALLVGRLSEDELEHLTDLLERLAGGVEGEPCEPGTPDEQAAAS